MIRKVIKFYKLTKAKLCYDDQGHIL